MPPGVVLQTQNNRYPSAASKFTQGRYGSVDLEVAISTIDTE